jgi:hypothetical protein
MREKDRERRERERERDEGREKAELCQEEKGSF